MFAGEVTILAPADDAVTSKPRGYVWMEYGNPPLSFIPTSGEFGTNKGYAATTDNWYVGSPTLQHPLLSQSWPDVTLSTIFKASIDPSDLQFLTPYGLGGATHMSLLRRSANRRIEFDIRSHTATVYNQTLANGGITLNSSADGTIDWSVTDWYCLIFSYSQSLNSGTIVYVNLTRGEEVVESAFIANNINMEWHANNAGNSTPGSSLGWGCQFGLNATTVANGFFGTISSTFIHDDYMDLTIPANRRKFSGINGVIDTGENGELIFGATPYRNSQRQ